MLFVLQCDVLVLGAGASGLAAARRLTDFGLKVREGEELQGPCWSRKPGRLWRSKCAVTTQGVPVTKLHLHVCNQ